MCPIVTASLRCSSVRQLAKAASEKCRPAKQSLRPLVEQGHGKLVASSGTRSGALRVYTGALKTSGGVLAHAFAAV